MKNLLTNFVDTFRGRNLVFHFLAICLTYLVVLSGFDWSYFQFFRAPAIQVFLFPAVVIGSLGVLIAIITPLIIGTVKKNKGLINTSFAIAQAAFLGWLISSIYKTFTGRGYPELRNLNSSPSTMDFHFGFMEGGIFWGWPSGHSMVAFAMGVTLFLLFPKSKLRYLALFFSFYIAFGVSTNIHWFSDALAGSLIGVAIGISVARSFKNEV